VLKEFFENGVLAFQKEKDTQTKKLAKLEGRLSQKNKVLSELMEEHVNLKKILGKPESHVGTSRYQGSGDRFCMILVQPKRYLCTKFIQFLV
jgi:hypothetical protein